MKAIKFIGTIIKNFFLILFEEAGKFFTIPRRRRLLLVMIIIAALGFGGYKAWRYYHPKETDQNLNLSQAAKIGEVTTHKLMVMIENRNCPPEIASGCYQRGDIVLIKPADFEFSDAEKTGFLILKMDITDKQAEVLVKSLEQKAKEQPKPASTREDGSSTRGGEKTPDGAPMMEQLKMRKYTVDLKKIGIADDVTKGQVMDTVYGWDIVGEK